MSGEIRDNKGLETRLLAVALLKLVLDENCTLDEAIERGRKLGALESRDRAFVLLLVLTAFRHLGEIRAVLGEHLTKPLPRKSGSATAILWLGIAQLLFLDTPAHAAIDMAVRSARADRDATHFSGLINAVLRKVSAHGKAALEKRDSVRLNTPDWLWHRWERNYGPEAARLIGQAHALEPALDIAVKTGPAGWAERLGGILLPTGHIRLRADHAAIPELPGFAEGAWWVQDAAAALPALLFGALDGRAALDLCAAPGGKTLQMSAAGAAVTAVDISAVRLQRLRENLQRTGLRAEILERDVLNLEMTELFDAVLLDAPCSATGTIRRHPELPYLKTAAQIGELKSRQRRMLHAAAERVGPEGKLVYCTCSLEPEEGEKQIAWFLSRYPAFELCPPAIPGLPPECVAPQGWIRILPFMKLGEAQGLDGFFAAAMQRRG